MDRRRFVTRLTSLTAIVAVNSTIGLALSACSRGRIDPIDSNVLGESEARLLTLELAHLSDSAFEQFARRNSGNELYQALLAKGVVSDRGEFFDGVLGTEEYLVTLVEYKGFYYTQTELELYGLAYTLVMSQATT